MNACAFECRHRTPNPWPKHVYHGFPEVPRGGARGGASCTPALESFAKGRGGLGHRQRRRSSVRLAGAAARFEAVLGLAQAPVGVPMKFRHRAGRAPHQQACPLSAHARLVVHPLARFLRPIEIVKRPVKFVPRGRSATLLHCSPEGARPPRPTGSHGAADPGGLSRHRPSTGFRRADQRHGPPAIRQPVRVVHDG